MAGRAAGRGRSGAAVGGSEGIIASSTGRGDGSRGRGWRPSRPTRIPHATTLDDVLSEIMAMRCYGDQSPPSSLLHKASLQVTMLPTLEMHFFCLFCSSGRG